MPISSEDGAGSEPVAPDTGPEAQFLAHLRAGRLMLQRDPETGRTVFPPRLRAPGTGAPLTHWAQVSGRGTIHAFTVEHRRPPAAPEALVLVDLDEGGRVLSRIPGADPDGLTIGAAVRARIVVPDEGTPHIVFDPDPSA
jgi:uncharacterized OB-fold protein